MCCSPHDIAVRLAAIAGIKWGNYVGAPGNEPVLCWKHKHRTPLASLVPLTTGDVFGLPNYTTLLLGYTKEKGLSIACPRTQFNGFRYTIDT